MMKYKAIFFDLDGTLTTVATHQIPASAIEALRLAQAQGVKLFLATGRHPLILLPAAKSIPFDGYLTINGQLCYNEETVIHRAPIPRADKAALVELLHSRAIPILFEAETELYFNKITDRVRRGVELLGTSLFPVKDPAAALEQDIYMLLLFAGEDAERAVVRVMPGCKSVRGLPDFADIIPKGGGKDAGIDAVLAHYGIAPEETMAFGEGDNDIGMLSRAGLGIAMGNAAPHVKGSADYVTGAPEEDGIYNALKQFGVI